MSVYYVQRICERRSPAASSRGVDRHFIMDYMGSAEFEFGALLRALWGLRSVEMSGPVSIEHDGAVCWFVGPAGLLDEAREFFVGQLSATPPRLKEFSGIKREYESSDGRYVGWWNLADASRRGQLAAPGWAIFRKKAHAALWLEALESVK